MGGRGTYGGGIEKNRLPDLEGSVKQIKWANDLREDYLKDIKFAEYMLNWYEKKADKLEEEYAKLKKEYDAGDLESRDRSSDRGRFLDMDLELRHIEKVTSDVFMALDKFVRSDKLGKLNEPDFPWNYGLLYSIRMEKNRKEKNKAYTARANAKKILNSAKMYAKEENSSKKWIEARKYITGYDIKGINDIKFEYVD